MIIHLIVTDTIRKFGCQARSTQRITDIEESVSSYKRYREQVLRSAARLDFRRATFFSGAAVVRGGRTVRGIHEQTDLVERRTAQ